jgi:diguanylate cyclase (GGDEF)-like protein/PAS domain S-box-containing protein
MDTTAEVLRAATLDLTRTLDLSQVLERLLERLHQLVPYDTANVMLLEEPERLVVRAIRGYERWGRPELVRDGAFDARGHPVLGPLIASAASLLIADAAAEPRWQRHPGAEHVRSWIGVPLLAAGRPIGLYAVESRKPGFFTPRHVALTEALAPHAAVAIQNARLFQRVQLSEERFRALVENSSEAILLASAEGRVLYSSLPLLGLTGEPVEALAGSSVFERLHPDDVAEARAAFAACLAHAGAAARATLRVRHADGSWRWVEGHAANRLADPAVRAVVVNYRDVTEQRAARERIEALNRDLQRQVGEFQTLLDVIPIGIAVARDPACRMIAGNRYLNRLLGLRPGANASLTAPAEERPGRVAFTRDGRPIPPDELPMQQAAATGQEVRAFEMDVERDGRRVATILGGAAPLYDESGRPRGAIGTALDISDRKRAEEQIRSLAYRDPLTGLPNRLLFADRLALAVAQAHRHGQRLAILFLDLDRFKVINDSLGHGAGDRLIEDVAARLRACLREGDTVARLGGDEFTLLLPDVASPVDAARVADKVLHALRQPFPRDGRELFVTASIGISLFPEDGRDAETLVKHADTAMYRAKERGRDRYQIYSPEMSAQALERLALESGLRRALAQGELALHYQPVLDVASRRVLGLEALLRWRHPGLGLLEPSEFVPLAEVTGLIVPMGPWVLRTACAEARALEARGLPRLEVAVNLTARQLQQADLAQRVREALAETGLEPERLELEITESGALESPEAAVTTLRELKALGVRLAIDDFGTGYSSLSYLKRLPLDTVKIDQSFIRDITRDPDDAAIVSAVIAMAHRLKRRVVAEGVEDEAQLAFLRAEGCDCAQGWLFSRALPAEALPEALAVLPARPGPLRERG